MPNRPFSKYSFEFITESYGLQISRSGQLIYAVFILAILSLVCSLPFFKIQVSVKSSALIRPTSEISAIRSLVNGRVKQSFVIENKLIVKGETLYVIESELVVEREKLLTSKIEDIRLFVKDFKNLLGKAPNPKLINAPMLRQSFFSFDQRVHESTTRLNKVQADYKRNQKLHNEAVIADAEFENFTFDLDKATNDLELVRQNQLSQWQTELRTLERELLDLEGQLSQLQKEKENLIIKAPVSGNIQNMAGIYAGSMVFANQDLAQISPDTSLIVESFVNPNDIGCCKRICQCAFRWMPSTTTNGAWRLVKYWKFPMMCIL
jgi:multidrug resistance efflux pump